MKHNIITTVKNEEDFETYPCKNRLTYDQFVACSLQDQGRYLRWIQDTFWATQEMVERDLFQLPRGRLSRHLKGLRASGIAIKFTGRGPDRSHENEWKLWTGISPSLSKELTEKVAMGIVTKKYPTIATEVNSDEPIIRKEELIDITTCPETVHVLYTGKLDGDQIVRMIKSHFPEDSEVVGVIEINGRIRVTKKEV